MGEAGERMLTNMGKGREIREKNGEQSKVQYYCGGGGGGDMFMIGIIVYLFLIRRYVFVIGAFKNINKLHVMRWSSMTLQQTSRERAAHVEAAVRLLFESYLQS